MKTLTYSVVALLALSWTTARADEPNITDLKTRLSSPDYDTRNSIFPELLHVAQKRPLKKEEIDLLLRQFQSDADWRIKTKICLVLPAAADRDWVLEPLRSTLKDRGEDNSSGVVALYASDALIRLGDTKVLPLMEGWLRYVKSNPKPYSSTYDTLVKCTTRRITALRLKLQQEGSNKSIEPPP